MRAARVVVDALRASNAMTGVQVFTSRVADVSKRLPAVVVLPAGGRIPDERFSTVASLTVDAYATTPAAAEDLAWQARGALLAVSGHAVGVVRTTAPPQIVPDEGAPGLARCLAVYSVQLPL